MAVRDLAISRGASTLIFDPNLIIEKPSDNYRDMDSPETIAHIREMADCIKESGNENFPPINIYQDGDSVCVSAGWCRRRAHILAMKEGAPIKGILCLTVANKKPEDLTLAILTSNDGLPLTSLEKAKAVVKLKSFMWSPAEIAKKTGWSLSHVNNLITLHDAPDTILNMVKDGKVSATLATKLVKSKGADKAQSMLEQAVDKSTKAGKKKATQSDLDKNKKSKFDREKWGPECYKLLSTIYDLPIAKRKSHLDNLIAQAGLLCERIEDKLNAMEG
jgi:hypothetical protein